VFILAAQLIALQVAFNRYTY